MVLAGSTLLLVVLIGTGLTTWTGVPLRFEERIVVGGVIGLFALGAGAFVGFRLAGMGPATLVFGLSVSGSPGLLGLWVHRATVAREARVAWARLRRPARDPRSLRPLVAFSVACAAVSTRVMALAYQASPGGLRVGHLSGYSDWAAHLAYAGSFAYGDNRALESPISAGSPIGYHFAANFVGGLFTTTGIDLTTALVVTTWFVAVLLPPLMWCVVMRLVRSRATACVSILLFTLSGGIGAWYFLGDVGDGGWRTVTALPRTYSRMPDQGLWLDNTISASLYAQRSTQLGVAIGLAALLLVLASRPARRRCGYLVAGLLIGACGITWAHMLVSGVALAALAALRERRADWGWFLAPAVLVGAPLTWWISPDRSSLRWNVGWMAPETDQPWIVFWLRNAALLLPLFAAIAVLGAGIHRLRVLSAPFWLWFIVPNVVAFHPWNWNNTKFFLFWQWAGSIVVASWLVGLIRAASHTRSRPPPRRRTTRMYAAAAVAIVVVASSTATGALDTLRAMQRSSAIDWVDDDDLAAARWLRDRARPGDVMVYGATNRSAVAALGGVPALSGYEGWTYDLGKHDWYERWQDSLTILRGGADAVELVDRYGVDYVVIGPHERSATAADDAFWLAHATLVFERGQHRIYRT